MSVEKKIFDFDKNELFVSERVLEFILTNAKGTILENDFPQTIHRYKNEFELDQGSLTTKVEIKTLIKLLEICKLANATTEQFFLIGNRIHELHILVGSMINLGSEKVIDWKQELNLFSLSIKESKGKMTLSVVMNKILFIDFQEYVQALKSILKGFFARIFEICFGEKPLIFEGQDGFNLTHTLSAIIQFDYVKLISDEEYVYSRLKNYLNQKTKRTVVDKISYYLFKDIKFSIDEIASNLNLSVRSLQRKLKEENNSFRSIKETIRKELSKQYLYDTTLSMHDVTMLLGYSERSAFEKAFKKWYDINPAEYRKGLR